MKKMFVLMLAAAGLFTACADRDDTGYGESGLGRDAEMSPTGVDDSTRTPSSSSPGSDVNSPGIPDGRTDPSAPDSTVPSNPDGTTTPDQQREQEEEQTP